ncbi:MAG: hypothetical protein P8074_11210 [Anaerolineales bacterium]|jgi:isopentenyldiphosphate isomerase
MSAKKVFLPVILVLVLVSLFTLTACQPTMPAQALGAKSEVLPGEAEAAFDYEQAAAVTAYRWNAMAQEYKRLGLLNYKTNPDDVMAYRWNAMAQEYKRLGLLNYKSNSDDVMAYRWNAMAQEYQRLGLLNYKTNPDDVMAYRWLAMAKFYERNGLLNEHSR